MGDIKEKTADEIKILGATKTETESFITYTCQVNEKQRILFWKDKKLVIFEEINCFDMELLQAINKKCKELRLVRR